MIKRGAFTAEEVNEMLEDRTGIQEDRSYENATVRTPSERAHAIHFPKYLKNKFVRT